MGRGSVSADTTHLLEAGIGIYVMAKVLSAIWDYFGEAGDAFTAKNATLAAFAVGTLAPLLISVAIIYVALRVLKQFA